VKLQSLNDIAVNEKTAKSRNNNLIISIINQENRAIIYEGIHMGFFNMIFYRLRTKGNPIVYRLLNLLLVYMSCYCGPNKTWAHISTISYY